MTRRYREHVKKNMNVDTYLNCWQFNECGREPGGKHVQIHGVCPVAVETDVDGIHNGKNGGRCCWVIHPFIYNEEKGKGCCMKNIECYQCDFYSLVKKSEQILFLA
ncbi:MAG: hypothetical protein QTN59_18440 [Candidatus Electrothrix communis]|nr:hypothetical protein [Desulfobulbus sp. US4]WLE96648.1 MAG: hypothetical protein QTN59_18440 [Candidatus Electrothrix communis]